MRVRSVVKKIDISDYCPTTPCKVSFQNLLGNSISQINTFGQEYKFILSKSVNNLKLERSNIHRLFL